MNIYLIERADPYNFNYDETYEAVIAAGNADICRAIARTLPGDQEPDVWESADIELIGESSHGVPRVILYHFNAG